MGHVGRWNTNSRTGASWQITLDSEEKIRIKHERGGVDGGWLTIERVKLLGLSSNRIFACDLDSQEGRTAFHFLARDAHAGSLDATPLGAFVKYLRTCRSVAEVEARCRSLMAIR